MTIDRDDAVISRDGANVWATAESVVDRLREAWDTLRRVPAAGVPGYGQASWPEIVQEHFHAYGYTSAVLRLSPASPRAIDRMHETFGWFVFLDDREYAKVVWLSCGAGLGSKRVGRILGLSRWTVRRYRDAAIGLIVDGIHKKRT